MPEPNDDEADDSSFDFQREDSDDDLKQCIHDGCQGALSADFQPEDLDDEVSVWLTRRFWPSGQNSEDFDDFD